MQNSQLIKQNGGTTLSYHLCVPREWSGLAESARPCIRVFNRFLIA